MKMPGVKLVFDRKNVSTPSRAARPKKGLVQIEIVFNRRQKFIGTGISVYRDQWSATTRVKNRSDMVELNQSLDLQIRNVLSRVNAVVEKDGEFTFERFEQEVARTSVKRISFLDFVEERISSRGDLRETTRRKHRCYLSVLREFGGIVTFSDLTPANVMRYDDYLHGRGIRQMTVSAHHKFMKTYINMAYAMDLVKDTPYRKVKIERGTPKGKKYLTLEELERFRSCELPEKLDKVRDVFLFQCYTALSYSDAAKFDFRRDARNIGGKWRIRDVRVKTDEEYYIVLTKPAMDILEKYDYVLPVISNQKMNDYLKVIAAAADIDKPISSHYGRHTFCVMAFNEGISPDVIARMMGHKNSNVTLEAYARLVTKTVDEGYKEMEKAFSR